MRGRGNRCHTEVVDADGWSEACNQPQAGTITTLDEYGRTDTYPACTECMAETMKGQDDA